MLRVCFRAFPAQRSRRLGEARSLGLAPSERELIGGQVPHFRCSSCIFAPQVNGSIRYISFAGGSSISFRAPRSRLRCPSAINQ